ncbi:3'-5' exonuclease [Hugenholtzia roseola]|uniref:3'-5' exonuclease n=1 Tax=Hugenholtzia roseola TaxID=1002 RepID=UPI00047C3D24|nr:3'-5' exonuclease [Hugenholtzia roseola]
MKINLKNPLAFFDLESTGTDIMHDRIVEISVVKLLPNGERQTRTKRINPTIPIPAEVTAIHGISDTDIADAPTFKQIAKSLADFLKGADLAGFNILRFDVPMLVEEFLRAGVDFNLQNRKIIDLQRIYHLMEPRTLSAAYKFYCGKELEGAHSAEVDTLACLEVLEAQIEKYDGVEVKDTRGNVLKPVANDMAILNELSLSRNVDLMGRMVYDDKNVPVFNFGKHKGKSVVEVLKAEPSYYDWMMKGDFALNTKQELTRIKLSMATNLFK